MVNSVQSLNNINSQRIAFNGEAGYAKTSPYPNDSYEKKSGSGKTLLLLASLVAAFAFRKNIAKVIPNCVKEFTTKWIKNPVKNFISDHEALRKVVNGSKNKYNGFIDKLRVASKDILGSGGQRQPNLPGF
ncbi:MAG: hypothetical protein PHX18_08600 [Candidatus Gastranaerophilales bacterium]|nr:hypothetical protein [Candidatus Gastranaerophilales bacterium]